MLFFVFDIIGFSFFSNYIKFNRSRSSFQEGMHHLSDWNGSSYLTIKKPQKLDFGSNFWGSVQSSW